MNKEPYNINLLLPFSSITNEEFYNLHNDSPNLTNPIYSTPEDIPLKFNINTANRNNLISVLHVNIRSLTKNVDQLHQLICSLTVQPEVIAITETKLNSRSNVDLIQLENYNFTYKNSLSNAGGVGVYIKKELEFTERKDIEFCDESVESIWTDINITKKQKITIGVLYRHPGHQIDKFSEQISNHLLNLSVSKQPVYITGDFNINFLDKTNKSTQNYFLMTKSYNFHNIIKQSTRVSKTTSSCIDHFYTNNKNSIHSKYILVNPISDHFPLYCTLKLKYTSKKSQPLYIRNFSKLNNDQLLSQTTQQLSNLLNNFIETPSEDIHQQFQKLSDTLKTIVNNNIPLEKLSRKKTKLKEKPWLTKEILNEIKIKNKMFKKLKKGKILDPDLEKKIQRT